MNQQTESPVDQAALARLESTNKSVINGATIAPGEPAAGCADHRHAGTLTADLIIAGINESRTLATLRDTLLPELISGGLRVSHAVRLIKEAS